jgi:L-fuculose-phosphate aldolase
VHPLYTSALAQLGVPLHIAHIDIMAFYDGVQYLPTWPGIPFGDEEGKLLEGVLITLHY